METRTRRSKKFLEYIISYYRDYFNARDGCCCCILWDSIVSKLCWDRTMSAVLSQT